jgi:signal transduction histidine kinase
MPKRPQTREGVAESHPIGLVSIPITAPTLPRAALGRIELAAAPRRNETLPQTALVDEHWQIVAVNEAWADAVREFEFGAMLQEGANYWRFWEWSLMSGVDAAAATLEALQAIEDGTLQHFQRTSPVGAGLGQARISVLRTDLAGRSYAIVSHVDQTELLQLRHERLQLNASLMRAQCRLLRVQESERERIARELHDSAAQYLTGIHLGLARLRQVSADPNVLAVAEDLTGLLEQFHRDVRGLTHVLHPPHLEASGLHGAIELLCEGLAKRAGLEVSLHMYGTDRRSGSAVEATAYRIVQEALSNIQRHAHARHVKVRLSDRPGGLFVVVQDDGVGLPNGVGRTSRLDGLGVGLAGMTARVHELGGRLALRSRGAGLGTAVAAMLPRHGRGQAFLSEELRRRNPGGDAPARSGGDQGSMMLLRTA